MPLSVAYYLADQNPHRDRSRGITRASEEIAHLIHADVALTEIVSRSSVRLPVGQAAATRVIPVRTDHAPGRLGVDLAFPALVRPRADVWFFPKGFVASPLPVGAPTLALVHDTILKHYAVHHPAERSRVAYAFWLGQLRASLRRATRVVTTSETSRRQIVDYCGATGIAPPPIDVIQTVPSLPAAPAGPKARPFALHLGSDAPHKRTAWLVDAWRTLAEAGRALPPLEVVGRLSPALRARVEALPGGVAHGAVADGALTDLYRRASVVVVPSEIEGFGLAPLEAYISGTPAVVTAGTALEEITRVGTPRGAFHPADLHTLADAVDDVLRMTPPEVQAVQDHLLAQFSEAELRRRVLAALHATASG